MNKRKWELSTIIGLFIFLLVGNFIFGVPVQARRGCCSWHGGVSYCDTSVGRYVCNDGTYSPSCGCSYIPPKVNSAAEIKNKINEAKSDYYKNPDWFREKLTEFQTFNSIIDMNKSWFKNLFGKREYENFKQNLWNFYNK